MPSDLLYGQSGIVLLLVLGAFLLLAGELGYRTGLGEQTRTDGIRAQVGTIQASLLGLFALLLGFTFSMAITRYDLRKQLVVKEANAIGTAALRARLLQDTEPTGLRETFRRYTVMRLEASRLPNLPSKRREELDAEASRIQKQLWAVGAEAAATGARPAIVGLYVWAVNDVIDTKEEYDAALANRVPESVLLLLFGFAILTLGVVGYGNGLGGHRAWGVTGILGLLVALVMLVIVDLDRPGRGLIHVSQQSMINLERALDAPKP